jgi:hypothetical protein
MTKQHLLCAELGLNHNPSAMLKITTNEKLGIFDSNRQDS